MEERDTAYGTNTGGCLEGSNHAQIIDLGNTFLIHIGRKEEVSVLAETMDNRSSSKHSIPSINEGIHKAIVIKITWSVLAK